MNYRGIIILVLASFLVGDEASRISTKESEEIIGNEKDEQQCVLEDKTETELKDEVADDTAAIDTLDKIQRKETIADVFKFIKKHMNDLQDYTDKKRVQSDVSEYVDSKKIENSEEGLAQEKALRKIAETKANSLEKEFEKYKNRVESQLNEQNTFKNCMPKKVAFHAAVSQDIKHFIEGQTIIFDDVMINLENGYNPVTGVFRTPVKGIYVVLVSVSSSGNEAPDYEVVHKGIAVCRAAVAVNPPGFLKSPCNAVLLLNPGEEIFAKVIYKRPTDIIRGQRFTTMSVSLIAAM